jgi:hypothetical protein
MARKTLRDGNTMIAVETASAVIDYADIVAATEVVEDRFENMTPWDHCDGFAHTRQDPRDLGDAADASAMQGYGRDSDGDRVVLQLTAGEDYGIYEHLRARGASKQVAREAVAAARRKTLELLVNWYENGWEWYGVQCEFSVLDEDFGASVWGIDDPEYAERDVVDEIAGEVAYNLEQARYTVTGQPQEEKKLTAKQFGMAVSIDGIQQGHWGHSLTPDQWRAEYARNLAAQNWKV